jgi:hypothetical protein
MTKKKNENVKTFFNWANKSWIMENENKTIKTGDTALKIMSGECQSIQIKDILYGDQFKTWILIIDNEDKIYLLKTSKELK